MVLSEFIVSESGFLLAEMDQLLKTYPAAGLAVRVTTEPGAYFPF